MTTKPLADQLAEQLVTFRVEELHASRRATAARLGVQGNTLRELELGIANPTLRRIEEVAAGLGLDVELRLIPRTATPTTRTRKATA